MITKLKKEISDAIARLPDDYQGELCIHESNIFKPVYEDGKVDTKNHTPNRYISIRCIKPSLTSSVDPYKSEIERYLISASPGNIKLLIGEIDRLLECEKEVEHWKNNHACEVARARVLKERPDMPLERVKAYDRMIELENENKALKERIEALEFELNSNLYVQQSILIDIQNMTRKQIQYWQHHFKNPNGW